MINASNAADHDDSTGTSDDMMTLLRESSLAAICPGGHSRLPVKKHASREIHPDPAGR